MTNNPADDDAFEDATDELPILLDTAVLDAEEYHVATSVTVGSDDTSEHTALFAAPVLEANEELEGLLSDLQAREAKIAALEQDIARLSLQWQEVERHLNAKDRTIGELESTVAELRRALAERPVAEPPAAHVAELTESLEQARAAADGLRHELAAANAAREAAEQALAASKAVEPPPSPAGDVQALREEVAALSDYIAGRRGVWNELESRTAAASARVKSLEVELAQRERRQRQAEALAERESARADSARAALIEHSRAREALERELRAERAAPGAGTRESAALRAELESATAHVRELREQLAAAERRAADAEQAALAARQTVETAAAGTEPLAAAQTEVVARLEAELEQRKQALETRDHELAERERQLSTLSADLDRARADLAKTRTELDDKRSDSARLERALIEKDRSLEARDQRIATLQNELEEKLSALHRLNAMDLSIQGLNTKMAGRLAGKESTVEGKPSLVCISEKEPQHFVLDKSSMIIGRGSQCDIQILTHFVSREHARLTVGPAGVLIEDLGSTNGVFVNSVRVDRHELRNSDLVTIGETQFRFLETMAH